jgi:tetratricopeptide (TPR) repeat protein
LNKPFAAYRGSESYVFVCYAHKDADRVYSDLTLLNDADVNLWYDEGIPAGSSWRAEIATAIQGASKLLFFISEASLVSTHCLREVDFAINHDIEIVPVYLDNSVLPAELELVLNRVHALFRESDARYQEHLLDALQGGATPFAPLTGKKKNRTLGIGLALAAVAAVLLAWSPWNAGPGSRQGDTSIAAPSGYNSYLEGLDLVERWDKGDNLDIAIEKFREATSLDPEFALAYARLAEALRIRYALTGDEQWLDEAEVSATNAAQLAPNLAPVQVAVGRVQAARGNNDLAFAALERAVSIDPNDALANQAIASMYGRLGRMQDAEASFQKAISLDPENIASLDAYANFLFEQSRFDEAARQWQSVIRFAPDHFAALVNLGSALSETGKIAEAITVYQKAIDIKPSYMAWSNLGTAFSRGERFEDAAEAYRKALEIDDSDWLVWGNLAYVYSWMDGEDARTAETFARAIDMAEAARRQDPRDAWASSDLGLYYAKTGQAELAQQRASTALTLSPDSAEIYAAAAEVHELIGQRDKAVEFAHKALELGYSRRQFQRNPETIDLLADQRLQPAF